MKRFYKIVDCVAEASGWQVRLDGRGIRTAAGQPQIVPARALAQAMAAEWADQADVINPGSFLLRDMADFAIDVISPDRAAAIRNLLAYGETDTLCYRAGEGDALLERQRAVWEPLLAAAEHRWDVQFARIGGVMHRPQPVATLTRLAQVLSALDDFTLAGLRNLASLAASLVIGLAALEPAADAPALWDAANLEEDWQIELWGKDADALALRARRLETFSAAAAFVRLLPTRCQSEKR
jgi:chaperone required for assembly of F1-ATPase